MPRHSYTVASMFDCGKAECGERREDYATDAEVVAYWRRLCREELMKAAEAYRERHSHGA